MSERGRERKDKIKTRNPSPNLLLVGPDEDQLRGRGACNLCRNLQGTKATPLTHLRRRPVQSGPGRQPATGQTAQRPIHEAAGQRGQRPDRATGVLSGAQALCVCV